MPFTQLVTREKDVGWRFRVLEIPASSHDRASRVFASQSLKAIKIEDGFTTANRTRDCNGRFALQKLDQLMKVLYEAFALEKRSSRIQRVYRRAFRIVWQLLDDSSIRKRVGLRRVSVISHRYTRGRGATGTVTSGSIQGSLYGV
jgi:hypothetical protein